MQNVLTIAQVAILVLFNTLRARRDEVSIARDGVDAVGRALLDAGGPVAVVQFLGAADTALVPEANIHLLASICRQSGPSLIGQLKLRPRVWAATTQAAVAADHKESNK